MTQPVSRHDRDHRETAMKPCSCSPVLGRFVATFVGKGGTQPQKGIVVKIYLAARYSRREELLNYRDELKGLGHEVTSRWLDGQHQIDHKGTPIGDHGEKLVEEGDCEAAAAMRARFAYEDYKDVASCELLVHFSEEPRKPSTNRGGRHVELGLALGQMKRVIVIGYRENIFHWFEDVRFYPTWGEFLFSLVSDEPVRGGSLPDGQPSPVV